MLTFPLLAAPAQTTQPPPTDLSLTTSNAMAFLTLVIVVASFVATIAVIIQQRIGEVKREQPERGTGCYSR